MARKKSDGESTALAKWEQELAEQAAAAAAQEANTGGGQFFSLRGGILKYNDAPLPDNQMAVVILDSVLENTYYGGDFDPDSPQAPMCYAFGRDDKTMSPHEESSDKQSPLCAECRWNEWGSSDKGRGKACRNRRRLALIPAGTLNGNRYKPETHSEAFEKATIAYLALPPTSINVFGAWVKQVAGALQRPPHGVITRIRVVPDDKTQFKVTFEVLAPVSRDFLPVIMNRHKEAREAITFPYPKSDDSASKKTRGKKATKKTRRKY